MVRPDIGRSASSREYRLWTRLRPFRTSGTSLHHGRANGQHHCRHRRAEHRVPAEPAGRIGRCRASSRQARRGGVAIRPLPRRAQASCAGGRRSERHYRWRLGPREPEHARDEISERLCDGDIANTGTPKAGVFAEGTAKAVASALVASIRGEGESQLYAGAGSCYIEYGGDLVGRVDVDFFSGPKLTGTYHEPSLPQRAEKTAFGATRKARWFGL